MAPMLEEFHAVAAGLAYSAPAIPIVSTVTGALADAGLLCPPEYWVRQVADPVRFADAVTAAGADAFVELGPDGVLSGAARGSLGATATVAPLLRPARGEALAVLGALARLHVAGVPVRWPAVFAGTGARRADLPTYAFQHERYWPRPATRAAGPGLTAAPHPLLGAVVNLAESREHVLLGRISSAAQPWLAGHTVSGRVTF